MTRSSTRLVVRLLLAAGRLNSGVRPYLKRSRPENPLRAFFRICNWIAGLSFLAAFIRIAIEVAIRIVQHRFQGTDIALILIAGLAGLLCYMNIKNALKKNA